MTRKIVPYLAGFLCVLAAAVYGHATTGESFGIGPGGVVVHSIDGHVGVTCSGPPSSHFETYAGIVTKC